MRTGPQRNKNVWNILDITGMETLPFYTALLKSVLERICSRQIFRF